MSLRPLVSTIVTTYNKGPYLAEAIDSALGQDYRSQEILVIDDGSTDDSRKVAESFGDRVAYVYQENRGQSNAKNHGIRLARGEFIAFLDGDDRWRPGKLTRQMALFAGRPEIAVVYSGAARFTQGCQYRPNARCPRPTFRGNILDHLLAENFIPFSSAVVRRSCLEEFGAFDESLRVAEDYDLWLRLARECRFDYAAEVLADYRVGVDQIATRVPDQFRLSFGVQRRFIERYFGGRYPRPAAVRKATAMKYEDYGDYLLARDHHFRAFAAHLASAYYDPRQARRYLSALRALVPNSCVAWCRQIIASYRLQSR